MEYIPISKSNNKGKQLTNSSSLLLQNTSILKIRSVNQCIEEAKNKANPRMLFDELWMEGELCILFADTNLGKSILSVQIANSISKGEAIPGFRLEAQKQKVLYFDFEMSEKQFEGRYSNDYTDHYIFDNEFYRIVINSNFIDYDNFEKEIIKAIENAILKYEAKVLIIDNVTYLKTQATDTAKEALPLMKLLKAFNTKYEISILALAHTPKRNMSFPLTQNDVAGSKHFSNFTDSIFAIGESFKDKSLRYIKQIKNRGNVKLYDSENVIICEINKAHNFLKFEFLNYASEKEHLRAPNSDEQTELEESIIALKKGDPNISNREIANKLNTYPMKVGRILDKHNL